GGGPDGADDILLPILPHRLLADEAHTLSLAALVVDEARRLRVEPNLGLVSGGDPLVPHVTFGHVLGPVLDAGIVRLVAAEAQAKLEILDRAAGPEDERVAVGGILLRRFA